MMRPPCRQIRASAGSGKTYELTTCFLMLLAEAGDFSSGQGCSRISTVRSWPEITAITFTNRAAAEMRERIIARLKDMALAPETQAPPPKGLSPRLVIAPELAMAGWTPALARRYVSTILRHMSLLNVRTIDSLLHLVVRLSALDLDLPPNFEPVFATEEALAPLLDSLLEQARPEHDPRLAALLAGVCHNIFFHTKFTGFLAGSRLREHILKLLSALLVIPEGKLASPEKASAHLASIYGEACSAGQAMLACLKQEKLAASAHFIKALTELDFLDKTFEATGHWREFPSSKMLHKEYLDDCLLKTSKGRGSAQAETAFSRLKRAIRHADTKGKMLRQALSILPYVGLVTSLKQGLPAFLRESSTIPADFVPRLARDLLERQQGVSDAICRLGSGLTHILMDEFQDTSREQWHAIHPLVLEALSKGGSFTWVGDIKQAIYGWRKGDAALFDEALSDPALTAVVQNIKTDSLLTNWRSCRAIVTTNNTVFGRLAEKDTARAVLGALLPKRIPQTMLSAVLDEHCPLLERGFTAAGQTLPGEKAEGWVHLCEVEGNTSEERKDNIRDKLLSRLKEVEQRRPWGDVAILVRSNKNAAIVANWLMQEGIPVVTENSFLLAEHPIIIQLVALLRFLDSPDDDSAFLALLFGSLLQPLLDVPDADLNAWMANRKKNTKQQESLCAGFRRDFPHVWKKWLEPFHGGIGLLTPYDAAREALNRLQIHRRFPQDNAFVQRFLEVLHLAEERGYTSFSTFLEQWRKNGQNEKAPMPENLDAVRVMTIHKAKGLQFPVVIIPWHDFEPKARKEIVPVSVDGLSLLAPCGPAMGLDYYRTLLADGREMLHLLYVAWTRPEEELHAFLPQGGQSAFGEALHALLKHLPFHNGVYTAGVHPVPESDEIGRAGKFPNFETGSALQEQPRSCEEAEKGVPPEWRPMHWLPRLRIFRTPLSDLTLRGKRRGLFVHHCLSCLQPPSNTQNPCGEGPLYVARQAVEWGLRSFPFPLAASQEETENIVDLLAWYASLPEAVYWLRHGIPEQSIVDIHGKIHRADMVVEDETRIIVVEYKTGNPERGHEQQVLRYMRLLKETYDNRLPVEGALVYLDLKMIKSLNLTE